MTMGISQRGVDLIKRFEGLRLEAYQDVAGVWTIGYGHTAGFRNKRFGPESAIAEEEAEAVLRADLSSFENNLNLWLDMNSVTLNQNQYDALVSFIFNVGFHAFERSTAAKRLKQGNYGAAADALTWWNKATVNSEKVEVLGLTRRRAAEKALFLTSEETKDDEKKSDARPA